MTPLLDGLLVKFKRWDDNHLAEVVSRYGGTITTKMPGIRWALVEIDHTQASDLFQSFAADPDVEDVDFNSVMEAHTTVYCALPSGNATAEYLHGHKRMGLFGAWKHAKGEGTKVAIVDSGMNFQQRQTPSFASKTIESYNTATNDPDDTQCGATSIPYWQHGMGCAASAVADGFLDSGNSGFGTAPKADLAILATFQTQHATTAGNLAGVYRAYDVYGAKFISVSSGFGFDTGPVTRTSLGSIWWDVLDYLKDVALVFFSAGNNSYNTALDNMPWQLPAAFAATADYHFGVGCTSYEEFDKPAEYSNGGLSCNITAQGHSNLTQFNYDWGTGMAPNLVAKNLPAAGWVSDIPGMMHATSAGHLYQRLKSFDGTSCATPMMAGIAATIYSANPALTIAQLRSIILATTDKAQNPHFYERFTAATGVANAHKGVLAAKAMAVPGSVYPYLRFFGDGVETTVVNGVATTHLRGALKAEINGLSTNPVTSVELYADAVLLYSGAPTSTWGDNLAVLSAGAMAGKAIRIVVHTATATADETYTDIVAYSIAPNMAPSTSASPAGGQMSAGQTITLTAVSDNPPCRTMYRWDNGPWLTYAAPIPPASGRLEFYSVDALGNVEGGVDYGR